MYKIEFSKQALKDIQRIPRNYNKIIFEKIKILSIDVNDKILNIKKLKGLDGYRLRVGEYRLIYEINDETITIKKVQTRGNVYG